MATFTLTMLSGVTLHQRVTKDAERRRLLFQRWMKLWAQGLLDLFGFQVLVATPLPPSAAGPRLVVSNHRSPIDILLMLRYFGGVVLSRGDLARWPVLGVAAQRAETIFVDRADAFSGFLAVRALRERLSQGRTVIVFPEGATFAGDEVHEFQGGAFSAARGLSVEVVPVGVAYEPGVEFVNETFVAHMTRVASRPSTRVACAFGQPRMLSGSRKELAAALQGEVQALVEKARAALAG